MEGWVNLGSLIAARPGIEPMTAWSQVRRPNLYATESPSLLFRWHYSPAIRRIAVSYCYHTENALQGEKKIWGKISKGEPHRHLNLIDCSFDRAPPFKVFIKIRSQLFQIFCTQTHGQTVTKRVPLRRRQFIGPCRSAALSNDERVRKCLASV